MADASKAIHINELRRSLDISRIDRSPGTLSPLMD